MSGMPLSAAAGATSERRVKRMKTVDSQEKKTRRGGPGRVTACGGETDDGLDSAPLTHWHAGPAADLNGPQLPAPESNAVRRVHKEWADPWPDWKTVQPLSSTRAEISDGLRISNIPLPARAAGTWLANPLLRPRPVAPVVAGHVPALLCARLPRARIQFPRSSP